MDSLCPEQSLGGYCELPVLVFVTEVHDLSNVLVHNHLGTLVARKQGGVDGCSL